MAASHVGVRAAPRCRQAPRRAQSGAGAARAGDAEARFAHVRAVGPPSRAAHAWAQGSEVTERWRRP